MGTGYVRATHEVIDGAGFVWDIRGDGSIYDGSDDAFDGGLDFSFLGSSSYLMVDSDGYTFTTLPQLNYYGVFAQRQIQISSTDGYARFFDTITNAGDSTQSFSYRLTTDFGSDGSTVADTSSGDGAVTSADTWVTGYDSSGGTTPAGLLIGNVPGVGPAELSMNYDDVTYEYTLSLAPGQTVSFLSYAVQGNSYTDVSTKLADLQNLPIGALAGLDADQIATVVNWDIPAAPLDIMGTNGDDLLFGVSTDDQIRSLDGDDTVFGGDGNDTLRGGFGGDLLDGGEGNDRIFGDGTVSSVTTSSTGTMDTGQEFAISLTMDDAGRGRTTKISGFVSRQEITADNVDLVFAIDVSGSTDDTFVGSVNVGDRNGDGVSNTILDAEIASFEALHASIINNAKLPDANITIVPFASSASSSQTFTATEDRNLDGIADVLEYVRSLEASGGTDFEEALQHSLTHFQGATAGQSVLYFLSDGGNNEGGSIVDEVRSLLDLGVQMQSFGVGSDADEADLDIVDDNINNGSMTIVLDPSKLSEELLDPGISSTDLRFLDIYLNGVKVSSIDPADLVLTPFGLRYFELKLTGLKISDEDLVEIRAIANDGASTTISTSQTLESLEGIDTKDLLIGGLGNDILDGGRASDILIGGKGADELFGGAGRDVASYSTAETGVVVDLTATVRFQGEARGDVLHSIESLTGSSFGDHLVGNGGKNVLTGLAGRDVLVGNGGKDVLKGGLGRDKLEGGGGADKFQFKEGWGRDTIVDFQDDIDTIVLARNLWSGALTKQQVVDNFATVSGGDIVFDFGDDTLFLKGFSDLSELKDDLLFI